MRRAFVIAVLATALALVILACGLQIEGAMDPAVVPPDGAAQTEAALPDGEAVDDGIEATALPEIPIGPGTEEPVDAGVDAPGDCGSPLVADNFNTPAIGPEWIKYGATTPGLENTFNGPNGYVWLIPTNQRGKASGLFTVPAVVASSFVASFRYYAQTPSGFNDVGDGFTFSWLSSGTVNNATLGDAVSGAGLGMPKTLGGVAFALDSYTNSNIGDPSAPAFSLLHMEPAKGPPGSYNWHIKNTVRYSGIYDTWRTVTVTLDKGKLSADVDGTKMFSGEPVPVANITAIGFTAGTGGVDAIGFRVDTVRIEFKDAVCP